MNTMDYRCMADTALRTALEASAGRRFGYALQTLTEARETLLAEQKAVDPIRFADKTYSLQTLLQRDGLFFDELRKSAAVLPLIGAEFRIRLLHMGQGTASLALMRLAVAQAERFSLPCSQLLLESDPFDELLMLGFVLESTREQALKRLYQHETLFARRPRLIASGEIWEAKDWKDARLFTVECMRTRFASREGISRDAQYCQSASLAMAGVDALLASFENHRPESADADCWVRALIWGCSLMEDVIGQVRDESLTAWGEEILAPWVGHALFALDLNIMKGYNRTASANDLQRALRRAPAAADCPSARRLTETLAQRGGESFLHRLFRR